jgi:hypothetical protein
MRGSAIRRGFSIRPLPELAQLCELTGLGGANRASRSRTWRTWVPLQNLCPSAVGTPRSVNAAAIACGLVTPSACISAMMGASDNARAFARDMPVLRPASDASGVAPASRGGVDGCLFDGFRWPCIFPAITLTQGSGYFWALIAPHCTSMLRRRNTRKNSAWLIRSNAFVARHEGPRAGQSYEKGCGSSRARRCERQRSDKADG